MFNQSANYSYSRLWGGPDDEYFFTEKSAKEARDKKYRELKKEGINCYRGVIRNQLRKYWAIGCPCGEYCNVYYVNIRCEY